MAENQSTVENAKEKLDRWLKDGITTPGGKLPSERELGELLGLTPSNTSKVLRSVEQKGLVTRELCNEDRRQMYYSLTQQGRELLASVSCREVETPEILRDWLCG